MARRRRALYFSPLIELFDGGGTNCVFPAPLHDIFPAVYPVERFSNFDVLFTPRWAPDAPQCTSFKTRGTYTLRRFPTPSLTGRFCTRSDSHWAHIAFRVGLFGDTSSHPGRDIFSCFHSRKHTYLLLSILDFFSCPFLALGDGDYSYVDHALAFVHLTEKSSPSGDSRLSRRSS